MAEKYHISPSTGNPNRCYAKKRCPLGVSDADHHSTKEAARAAFERAQGGAVLAPAAKKTAAPVAKPSPVAVEEEPILTAEDELLLADDFSDILCEDCGKALTACICGDCRDCGAYEGQSHERDCSHYYSAPKAYSWD